MEHLMFAQSHLAVMPHTPEETTSGRMETPTGDASANSAQAGTACWDIPAP